jgi:adenosylhomocysteine nucleosidase
MSFDEPARRSGAPKLPKVGFVAALDVECASLRKQAPRAGSWLVLQSGPGAARAATAAARAIDDGARLLVAWGFAGGLDAKLAPGTVVMPRRVLQQGAEPLAVNAGWHARLAALADEFALAHGDLLTVPAALESPEAKRAAAAATHAVAVDMESAAIAAAAARARVAFVALRVVVDGLADALPRGAEQWIDDRGNRRLAPTLRAVATLGQWRPLLTLAKRYRTASGVLDRLAEVLAGRQLLLADVAARKARS